MKDQYFETIVAIERIHRLFLDVVKVELDKKGIRDLNNVQAVILYNLGKGQFTVGELTHRGYYLGSNVSYNLKKMVQNGYVIQIPSPHDKRSSHVKLSEKGLEILEMMQAMIDTQAQNIDTIQTGVVKQLKNNLEVLEAHWKELLMSGPRF